MLITAFSSIQLLSCVWLCDPMDCSMPGFPVHHQLPELTQIHVHQVGDAIQPSHHLLSYVLLILFWPLSYFSTNCKNFWNVLKCILNIFLQENSISYKHSILESLTFEFKTKVLVSSIWECLVVLDWSKILWSAPMSSTCLLSVEKF